MTATQPPPRANKPAELPLENIDRLLEAEDPEFTKQLEEVRAVEADQTVVIEAAAIDETLAGEEEIQEKPKTRWAKIKESIGLAIYRARTRIRNYIFTLIKDFFIMLKTRPKELFLFTLAMTKILFKKIAVPIKIFKEATLGRKILLLSLVAIMAICVALVVANTRGVWLPQLNEPILQSLEEHAEMVEKFNHLAEGESFYSAFPQERYEFLFKKFKVNLRRTPEHPLPMGAFEVIVLLDSKDTAIEVRDREVAFHDLLQRVFEEESFPDLESDLGKARLKGRIKRELNEQLTQGWVKEVSFRTFILKP